VQTLRAAGCGTIIAVDLDEGKLDLARRLGADVGLKSDACHVVSEVAQLTGGRGADVAFEVVGIAPTVVLAIETVRKGGSVTLVGNITPKVEMPLQSVVIREITVNGSCASCGEYPACLEMIARGSIDVEALISAVAPLKEGNAWFQRLYRQEPGLMKVILVP
jgi:L-iditol 2-dehydrogenase